MPLWGEYVFNVSMYEPNQMEIYIENLIEMLFNELETWKSFNNTQAEPSVGTITETIRMVRMETLSPWYLGNFRTKYSKQTNTDCNMSY